MSITVFFSYSHQDEALRDQLANHLSLLQRKGVITSWHDRQIPIGTEWDKKIKTELETADIILLLVSADFLASDYCWDVEVDRAMSRHEAGDAIVIPILLREVDWQDAPFGKLQGLPKNVVPVTKWTDIDSAFTDVAKGIRRVAEELAIKKQPRPDVSRGNKRLVGAEVLREIPVWVGREQILARLEREFLIAEDGGERPKMLVLVGQGGMGKTSLAVKLIEAAGVSVRSSAVLPSCLYEQVICFKAQEGTSFDEVTSALISALSVQAGEGLKPQERIQKVIEGLQKRRCLLLIDNLEVVLHPGNEARAGFAIVPEWGRLLNALANLPHQSQVILTSREQPKELGDLQYPEMEPDGALVQIEFIGGVSIESGVELLRKRGLRDSEADLRWVAERVQGNAFMLTLLANVAKGKPGYLRKHPGLVTQRAEPILRSQLERQSEAGRELLKRMCVLRVPIDLHGLTFLRVYRENDWIFGRFRRASQLNKAPKLTNKELWETQELVQQLVDCSLVQCQYDEQRQEELYDLHRLSAEFLQSEYRLELPDLLKRTYSFYKTGKSIDNPKTLKDLQSALEAQHFAFRIGNYSEALSLIFSFEDYLERWGHWDLLKDLCEQLLPKVALKNRSLLLGRIGSRHRAWGNWDEAERHYKQCFEIEAELGDRLGMASFCGVLGDIERDRGNWDEAERHYKQCFEIEAELGDRSGMASSWGALGSIERRRGNWDEAERRYKQSLELRTELGDRSGMAVSIGCLGETELGRGNLNAAEELLKQALDEMQELGMAWHIAETNYDLAVLEYKRGNIDRANSHYAIAHQGFSQLGAEKDLERIEREWRELRSEE